MVHLIIVHTVNFYVMTLYISFPSRELFLSNAIALFLKKVGQYFSKYFTCQKLLDFISHERICRIFNFIYRYGVFPISVAADIHLPKNTGERISIKFVSKMHTARAHSPYWSATEKYQGASNIDCFSGIDCALSPRILLSILIFEKYYKSSF